MNKLSIEDRVRVNIGENVIGNGEIVTITQIAKFNGAIHYVGEFESDKCASIGMNSIQFKEGEYEYLPVDAEL